MKLVPWIFLCAAAIVALARWLHPATYGVQIFSVLVLLSVVTAAVSIVHKRYE